MNTSDILFILLQKGLFEVIGLYAADIMRGCAVQGVHQKLQGLTKLDTQRQKAWKSKTLRILFNGLDQKFSLDRNQKKQLT